MNIRIAILIAAFFAVGSILLSSGCAVTISDAQVLRPPATDPARDTLAFDGEDELDSEFGAIATHERLDFAGLPIAVSRVEQLRPGAIINRPLILSCGGNASDRVRNGVSYAAKILPHGDAILFDYPGYGDSGGEANIANLQSISTEFTSWLDAQAADRPLILWGHSLGGFVCSQIARQSTQVDAVILETTARNVGEVARAWKPWWAPVSLRVNDDLRAFDSANALADFTGPILVIGAGRDQVLPVKLHRSLAAALPDATTYLELPQATHYSAGFDPATLDAVSTLTTRLRP